MLTVKRGETTTFSFKLNVPLDILGDPRCIMSQGNLSFPLETSYDLENNALIAVLDEGSSTFLIGGFTAWIQHQWTDGLGKMVAFPKEEVYIERSYVPVPDFSEYYDLLNPEDEGEEEIEETGEDEGTEIIEESDESGEAIQIDPGEYSDEYFELVEGDDQGT